MHYLTTHQNAMNAELLLLQNGTFMIIFMSQTFQATSQFVTIFNQTQDRQKLQFSIQRQEHSPFHCFNTQVNLCTKLFLRNHHWYSSPLNNEMEIKID